MQEEIGARIAGLGLVELVAEGGQCLGAARGGERVEPDEQLAVAGDDIAGGGEGFADEGVGFVAGAGVVAVQGAGQEILSPCLSDAALMSRVLEQRAYLAWLDKFLP